MTVVPAVLRSEWTKLRSVRSTAWTLSLAALITVGLGLLLSWLTNRQFDHMTPRERLTFDPTYTSFAGMTIGQLLMIVFGVLVVSAEYSTGMIRTSLAAVPQRGVLLGCKVAVATGLAVAVGMVTAFAAFFAGQAVLGAHHTTIGEPGVLRAVVGGGLYLTLITVFAMGVAAMLRGPLLSLAILMPFFFLISGVLGVVGATRKVARYLPDQAGQKVMMVLASHDDRPYGPWTGLGIMALWVVAALAGGYLTLRRRDA
ncbi:MULTISPECIES: ABC transporter permease [Streptomycetaceae]|uniref:ABC transporter integral membrane protein n=1 Tax=Streptantibioticus cattleyicolor (strain ATCC 35852 / DSM 46488 / JCM 4925 / NBRC 14057 / NRRL 8057) TaxID=1003195 RepID=F8JQA7_STREN|nr:MULTISPECIES: ABC transporter permease [Streptomycetaceae]AEW96571.1 ABC transporter integral membrane protein [Streptantibioticus cattleyicolor NRRL 8057 = DSM 46488]MYS61069.1 ABC transporter permease subunit [Streptomyces sp. SID5468]CCB76907.1 putative ABC transporter permease protein [Streptantibioticus cattleyicolor NRRL 8057 = DSM 46488]